jgi:RNA polymerase sigma-70 factor (sigma-E family)
VRDKDEQAFVEFATGAARSLRRTAFLMTGDWHRADDVVQNALVKLYVAWPRLTKSGAFPTYARRAVVTSAIDEGRRPWRRERSDDEAGTLEPDRHDHMGEVDDRMIILAALAKLPPRQRATVVLRYYDELTVEETAEVLGCTTGTVKSQTARGLDALRERLVAAGVREPITVGEDRT